ncbi:MAG: malonate transporter [Kiritimatiellia bacterium]|jgi:malonate transporter
MIENLIFTANAVAPIFAVILLGAFLQRRGFLTDAFSRAATQLVFYVGLPALVFVKVAETDFETLFDVESVLSANVGTVLIFLVAWGLAAVVKMDFHSRGSFTQGAFRSNVAIFAFPVIYNVLGDRGLSAAIIILAFLMPIYNVFAVVVLAIHSKHEIRPNWVQSLCKIITNPLIISALAGLALSMMQIRLPSWPQATCESLGSLAFPLGLLCIGTSLRFKDLTWSRDLVLAVVLKNIAAPLIMMGVACLMGVRGDLLVVLMLIAASPSAVAGFIMAAAMDNDARLAAAIVVATSAASVVTVSVAIFWLKSCGLI